MTSDDAVRDAYSVLDPMVARYDQATEGLYEPGVDADPDAVAQEITGILALPVGAKPFRSVIDFTGSKVAEVNQVAANEQRDFITRMGFGELLQLKD